MKRYKSYSKYKEPGIGWLGQVPERWVVIRGKYIFSEISSLSRAGEETLLSVSEYYGVKPRSETVGEEEMISRADSLVGYKKCATNDLVMNIMLAWKCGLGVTKYNGIVSPAYSVFRFRSEVFPGFMHYLLRTPLYTTQFKARSTGIIDSRLRLYPEVFGNVEILLPSRLEQTVIATFLDRETARIDALIEKKETQICLLQEKRQALISHAVANGLDPNAPMKDSGIEWLGQVPEHWGALRVKHVATFITSGPRGWSDFIDESGQEIFLQSGDLNNYLQILPDNAKRINPPQGAEGSRTMLQENDVVVCITGANTGRVAMVDLLPTTTYINQHLCLIRIDSERWLSKYLALFLSSKIGRSYFEATQSGLKEGLSLSNIADAPLAGPPFEEQIQICNYLDRETARIDTLINKTESSIDLLREHRSALITAAVTGQIDVREMA